MALIITEPIKTVNGLLTKAIAALSQLLYLVQRKDNFVDQVCSLVGGSCVKVFGDVTDQYVEGDLVFVSDIKRESDDALSIAEGFTTVALVSYSSPYTSIGMAKATTGFTPLATQMTGFINNVSRKAGYHIELQVFGEDDALLFDSVFEYVANQSGYVSINVGKLLSLYQEDAHTFALSKLYYLGLKETWNGIAKTPAELLGSGVAIADADGIALHAFDGDVEAELYVGRAVWMEYSTLYAGGFHTVLTSAFGSTTTLVSFGQLYLGNATFNAYDLEPLYFSSVAESSEIAGRVQLNLNPVNIDTSPQYPIGMVVDVIFNSIYTSGKYTVEASNFNNAAGANRTNVTLNEAFVPLEDSDGTLLKEEQKTTLLQSLLARKQLLKEGGANMWEYLLIEGGSGLEGVVNPTFTGTTEAGGFVVIAMANNTGFLVGQWISITSEDGLYNNAIGQVTNVDVLTLMLTTIPASGPNSGAGIFNADFHVGKFLTRFENPIMWRGWVSEISYLVDQVYASRIDASAPKVVQRSTDVNKHPIGSDVVTVGSADIDIHQYTLLPEAEPSTYQKIEVWNNALTEAISETMYFEVKTPCTEPIMVDWENSLGGIDHWLFAVSQTVTNTVGEGVLAERVIDTDIEFITRTKQRFPGPRVQRMLLKAEKITRDQVSALDELKRTSVLRVHLTKDGSRFIDVVVVNTFSTTGNTKYSLFDYSVEIEFPDDFDFFRAKDYVSDRVLSTRSAEVQAAFDKYDLLGDGLTADEKIYMETYINSEVENGNYAKKDYELIMGLSGNNSLVDYIGGKVATAINAPTHSVNGYTFDGTNYLKTNFVANNEDTVLTGIDRFLGAFAYTVDRPNALPYDCLVGAYKTNGSAFLRVTDTFGIAGALGNTNGHSDQTAPPLEDETLVVISRPDNVTNDHMRDGQIRLSTTDFGSAKTQRELYIGARNNNDTSIDYYYTGTISSVIMGATIGFGHVAYNTNLRALLTALNI